LQVEKELAILRQLHHPHLVSFMFIADQGSRISIIMDWAGENLREHRTVTQSQQYTEDVARYMMYQLTSALVYLHSKVGHCMQCTHTESLFTRSCLFDSVHGWLHRPHRCEGPAADHVAHNVPEAPVNGGQQQMLEAPASRKAFAEQS
jgi:serine/threonine protein kinase